MGKSNYLAEKLLGCLVIIFSLQIDEHYVELSVFVFSFFLIFSRSKPYLRFDGDRARPIHCHFTESCGSRGLPGGSWHPGCRLCHAASRHHVPFHHRGVKNETTCRFRFFILSAISQSRLKIKQERIKSKQQEKKQLQGDFLSPYNNDTSCFLLTSSVYTLWRNRIKKTVPRPQ